MTDFEAGLRKAINEFYPDAVLHGCWYHFCAAVRRKFMSLDMYELISKVPAAKSIYRMILSLPLLPKESILNGYNIVKQEAIDKSLHKKFMKIFEYFEQYWLRQVSFYFHWSATHLVKTWLMLYNHLHGLSIVTNDCTSYYIHQHVLTKWVLIKYFHYSPSSETFFTTFQQTHFFAESCIQIRLVWIDFDGVQLSHNL